MIAGESSVTMTPPLRPQRMVQERRALPRWTETVAACPDHFMTGSEDGTVRQFDLREAPRNGGRDEPDAAAVIGALLCFL